MSDQYLGEIRMVGFNFAPTGWFLCDGQTLSISQYTALFSLIGTFYGGNGTSTFQLPNLQGRVPIHQGTGAGLSPVVIGQEGGEQNVTLLQSQMPAHSHQLNAGAAQTTNQPGSAFSAQGGAYATAASTTMSAAAIANTGGGQPFSILQPYLVVNFIIAFEGIFPSRN